MPDIDEAEARLKAIFRRHSHAVAEYVRRRVAPELADDVVAETFLVAWRRLDDVPDDALPWLIGVARKTLGTQQRSARRRRFLLAKLEGTHRTSDASDEADELGVADALAQLSEKDREAITLIAWDGLTPNEAAVVVGQSPVAFRVRLHRAKRRLSRLLETPTRLRSDAHPLVANDIALTKGGLRK